MSCKFCCGELLVLRQRLRGCRARLLAASARRWLAFCQQSCPSAAVSLFKQSPWRSRACLPSSVGLYQELRHRRRQSCAWRSSSACRSRAGRDTLRVMTFTSSYNDGAASLEPSISQRGRASLRPGCVFPARRSLRPDKHATSIRRTSTARTWPRTLRLPRDRTSTVAATRPTVKGASPAVVDGTRSFRSLHFDSPY